MAASAKANHPRRSLCARRVIDPDPAGPESLDRASPSSLLRMTALPFQHAAGVESGCRFRKCKSQKCSRSNLSGMDPVRTLAVITSPHVFISVESKGGYVALEFCRPSRVRAAVDSSVPLAQSQLKPYVLHLRSRSRPTTLVALVIKRPGGLFLHDNSAQTARRPVQVA